jgi:hypothetical protein
LPQRQPDGGCGEDEERLRHLEPPEYGKAARAIAAVGRS